MEKSEFSLRSKFYRRHWESVYNKKYPYLAGTIWSSVNRILLFTHCHLPFSL